MNKFQEFVWQAHQIVQRSLPEYSSPYSRKDFTLWQLATLNLIRIKCEWTFRETVFFVQLMTPIRDHLGLEVMPHYTTIQKAFDRMTASIGWLLLDETLDEFDLSGFSGIDATGFDRSVVSSYYANTADMNIKAAKTTILADLNKQVIVDGHVTMTRKHDTKIAPKLTRKHPELSVLVADKGYDDQSFRDELREQSTRPLVRHRDHRDVGPAANARMIDEDYHQRSLVETIFYRLKQKYGDQVRARVWYRQIREQILRMVVFNIDRMVEELLFAAFVPLGYSTLRDN